jgi:hypothetical protein
LFRGLRTEWQTHRKVLAMNLMRPKEYAISLWRASREVLRPPRRPLPQKESTLRRRRHVGATGPHYPYPRSSFTSEPRQTFAREVALRVDSDQGGEVIDGGLERWCSLAYLGEGTARSSESKSD